MGRVGWVSRYCAPRVSFGVRLLRAGVFLWRAVGLLFSWVRGAWRGCSFPVFVRASARGRVLVFLCCVECEVLLWLVFMLA